MREPVNPTAGIRLGKLNVTAPLAMEYAFVRDEGSMVKSRRGSGSFGTATGVFIEMVVGELVERKTSLAVGPRDERRGVRFVPVGGFDGANGHLVEAEAS